MDVSRSLARQSLVVAAVAALIDAVGLGLCGVFAVAPWQTGAVMAGIIVGDLAAPRRHAPRAWSRWPRSWSGWRPPGCCTDTVSTVNSPGSAYWLPGIAPERGFPDRNRCRPCFCCAVASPPRI
ncbi:hypothetical protein [Nocardia sp. NPDC050175]|uniref:hypothetical protein n=1 Tax=Nocardia sp. NPDC050175 TaxID=3364317 RepID=UPI0037AB6E51